MSTERDTTRIVRSWLEGGVTDLPDRVLDAVLEQLPATPQRHPWWSARRFLRMNNPLKLAIAAGAVFTAGIIGLNLLPRAAQPGAGAVASATPTSTPVPTPVPSLSPFPSLPPEGLVMEPGRYQLSGRHSAGMSLSVEVPAGWTVESSDMIAKNRGLLDSEAGALFAFWPISGTFADPCTDHTLVVPTPGPGVDALADALADQPGTEAGPPSAVTVDGYPGKVVDSMVTADIEPCGVNGFWLWAWPDGQPRWVQGTDELNRMFVVNVDGERLTFNGRYPAAITAADRAELDAIIASIDIEP